jgi:hypothetical protein
MGEAIKMALQSICKSFSGMDLKRSLHPGSARSAAALAHSLQFSSLVEQRNACLNPSHPFTHFWKNRLGKA